MQTYRAPFWQLDWLILFLLYLTVSVVPLVYFNNPIATEYFFSKAFFFDLLVYGAVTLFFIRALLRKDLTIRWGYTFLPLFLFCIIALQSLIGATNVWKGWETIVRVGACIPFAFLLYQEISSRELVRRFLIVAAITNIGVTAYGFLQFFEVFPLPRDQYGTADPSTTIGLTNFVMEYLMPFMFVMPAMIFAAKTRLTRGIFLVATLFQYFYFMLSDNRAAQVGWLASLPIAGALLFLRYRRGAFRFSRRVVSIAAVVGVLGSVMVIASPLGQRFINRTQTILTFQDAAITFRIETWKQSLKIITDHPLRGVGLSNLEVEFPKYQSPFLERMTLANNTRVVRAHNEYVQVIADLGLLGAAAFGWFMIMLVRLLTRAYRMSERWDDLLIATGLFCGVSGYLVVSFFAFPFEVPSSALAIFLVIGLLEVIVRRVLIPEQGLPEPGVKRFERQWAIPLATAGAILTFSFWIYSTNWMWNVLHAEVYFKESRVMKDLKQWDVAQGLLDDAIAYYPQNEAYYYDRSIFAIRKGNVQEALRYLQKTAELVPNYAMGHKQMGLLAAQLGKYDEAADRLEFAYSIYKNSHTEYVPLLINAYLGSGQLDRAIELAKKKFSPSPEISLSQGQAFIQAKDYARAVSHLTDAVEQNPRFEEAFSFLAMAYNKQGEHEKALQAAEKAGAGGEGRRGKGTLALQKAIALLALDRQAEAQNVVDAAIAADPAARAMLADHPGVRNLLTK